MAVSQDTVFVRRPRQVLLFWIIATAVGLMAGKVLVGPVYNVLRSVGVVPTPVIRGTADFFISPDFAQIFLSLAFQGVFVGLAQGIVLQLSTDDFKILKWALYTLLGFLVAGIIFGLLGQRGDSFPAVVGVLVGSAQFLLLRQVFYDVQWWIAVTATAWGVATLGDALLFGVAYVGLIGMLTISIVTGCGLLRLESTTSEDIAVQPAQVPNRDRE